jgi:integrase
MTHPDIELIARWTAPKEIRSAGTARLYGLHGRRFLAWLTLRKGPTVRLASATEADAITYRDYLLDPEPAIPPDVYLQFGFTGPPHKGRLKPISVKNALVILNVMYGALARLDEDSPESTVRRNPFRKLTRNGAPTIQRPLERALTPAQWHAALRALDSWPLEEVATRARWLFLLAYYSLLHGEEIGELRMGDFRQLPSGRWVIELPDPCHGRARIAAPPNLLAALQEYRLANGLSRLPAEADPTPAFIPLLRARCTSSRRSGIYKVFKQIFSAAGIFAPEHAKTFSRASPEWVRHTGIAEALNKYSIAERYVWRQARLARYQVGGYVTDDDELSLAFKDMGPPDEPVA